MWLFTKGCNKPVVTHKSRDSNLLFCPPVSQWCLLLVKFNLKPGDKGISWCNLYRSASWDAVQGRGGWRMKLRGKDSISRPAHSCPEWHSEFNAGRVCFYWYEMFSLFIGYMWVFATCIECLRIKSEYLGYPSPWVFIITMRWYNFKSSLLATWKHTICCCQL